MNDRLAKLLSLFAADPDDTFVLYGLAQEHAKRGDHSKAIEFYDLTIAADPDYCYAYFHKAQAQRAMGDTPAALQTVAAGIVAAQRIGEGKALNELSGLQAELESGGGGA